MSNRKLRHDLEELKKEVAALRAELAARPTVIIREVVPATTPPYPGWPDTIITCDARRRQDILCGTQQPLIVAQTYVGAAAVSDGQVERG